EDMFHAVDERFADCDVLIATAAVSDYRPESRQRGKLKKKKEKLELTLVRNPDVLQRMGKRRGEGQKIVGFSLEVDNALDYAREKLEKKNCDVMVVTTPAHFGDSREAVRIINSEGVIAEVPPSSKSELAERICLLLADLIRGKRPELILCFAVKTKSKSKSKGEEAPAEGGGDS
ncbi:partial Cysteine/Cysteine sulfinic acid decarboxylase, partial [Planctomycetaceae bacterium]